MDFEREIANEEHCGKICALSAKNFQPKTA
jgi:hypothetical protein